MAAEGSLPSTEITPVQNQNNGTASDTSLFSITGHKLNGNNYLQWSQSVMMFICGKGKEDYLTGAANQPKKEDSKYRVWKLENNKVMSWLINSMTNDIGENFLLYETAKDIWEAAKEAILVSKIRLNYLRLRACLMTFDKKTVR